MTPGEIAKVVNYSVEVICVSLKGELSHFINLRSKQLAVKRYIKSYLQGQRLGNIDFAVKFDVTTAPVVECKSLQQQGQNLWMVRYLTFLQHTTT